MYFVEILHSYWKLNPTPKITYVDSPQTLRNHILGNENTGYFSSLHFSEFFKPLSTPPKSHQDNHQKDNLLLVDFQLLIKNPS